VSGLGAPDFTLKPRGPFTLGSAARFIAGWPPTAGAVSHSDGLVRLAFAVDDWSGHAGVVLRQEVDHGPVEMTIVETTATDPARVRDQAARVVSLDHDGSGYGELGERDEVIGALQRSSGWLRPVLFHSPYEAACWAVISTRMRQIQATGVRDELSAAHGARLTVAGEERVAFPTPEALLSVEDARGLASEKLRRLHGIARAALEGRLDRERLLAAPPDEALSALRELPGVGPFWSEGILLRAVGTTDRVTLVEPAGRRRAAAVYGLPAVGEDDAAYLELAERWRPFRTWAAVLLRATG
jgi:DNA-3-methyladenine glycosylase II